MKIRTIACLLLGVFALHGAMAAPATEQSIRELMTLTGSANIGIQMMQALLPALKRLVPDAPDSFWEDFMKGIQPDDLVKAVIPVYQRNLTEEDIQAALTFYKSPSGQRLLAKLPAITQQSMQAGQQWGQELAQRALAKLKAEQQKGT